MIHYVTKQSHNIRNRTRRVPICLIYRPDLEYGQKEKELRDLNIRFNWKWFEASTYHDPHQGQKNLLCCPYMPKIGKLGRPVDFFFFYIYTYIYVYTYMYVYIHTQFPMEKMNAVRMHLKVLFIAIFSKFFPQIFNFYTQTVFYIYIYNLAFKQTNKPALFFFRILRSVG